MTKKISMIILSQLENVVDILHESVLQLGSVVYNLEKRVCILSLGDVRIAKKYIKDLKSAISTLDIARFRVEDFQTEIRTALQKEHITKQKN